MKLFVTTKYCNCTIFLAFSKGSEVVAMEASTAAAIAAGVDKLRVTMVSWNVDDSLVVTAVSDCSIKVWDSYTGKLMHILQVKRHCWLHKISTVLYLERTVEKVNAARIFIQMFLDSYT